MSSRILARSNAGNNSGLIAVGNTYRRLSDDGAPFDRSGTMRKVHDVTIYADAMSEDESDLIEKVVFDLGPTFQPREFTCHSPVPVAGGTAMRFSTRQQVYGPPVVEIKVRCRGGTTLRYEHRPVLSGGGSADPAIYNFGETRPLRPLRMVKMPEDSRFGIELELTSAVDLSPEIIASQLSRGVGDVRVASSYREGREHINGWKLVPDSSISCNLSQPNCNTFELVSPVLQGGDGLGQVAKVTNGLGVFGGQVKINKSMGYHVHIDVSDLNVPQLIKVCQNFVKYEEAMDRFFPFSRRTGSDESNRYFQSNRASVSASGGGAQYGPRALSNRQVHRILSGCETIEEIGGVMQRNGSRYYKLNLQNLVTGRQPTLEFRQHSATASYDKISSWIRFCARFVTNSAKLASPSPSSSATTMEKQTDALFYYVIKDRALRDFYLARIDELGDQVAGSEGGGSGCCTGCARGGACSRSSH